MESEYQQIIQQIRAGTITTHTGGLCPTLAQFNLVVLPKHYAEDFAQFCQLNRTPCPLIFTGRPGDFSHEQLKDLDIRYDLPQYRIYENGEMVCERSNIGDLWRDDLVYFLIGCSLTFEKTLLDAGIPLPHIDAGKSVAMYNTNIKLKPSQFLHGNMVVSMRWVPESLVGKVSELTGHYPHFHGAPVHHGDPIIIGINNLSKPDYGDYVEPAANVDEKWVPVFWGCGVTPQAAIKSAKLPFAITHKPGCMYITSLTHCQILNLKKN